MNQVQIIINSIACINALMLCAILCFRRDNVLPNYMLGGIMAVPGLYFANSFLLLNNTPVPWLFFTAQFCAIFFIPFYSVYVYSILGKPISRLLPIFFISFILFINNFCHIFHNFSYLNFSCYSMMNPVSNML